MVWVLRISIVIVGVLGTLIAIFSDSIYGLYLLCSDLMYVVLFPQLTIVLWVPMANAYGSLAGFFVSFLLRILAGEDVVGIPAILQYPGYDASTGKQWFPHRSFAMMIGTVLIIVVSWITNKMFVDEYISREYDVLQIYRQKTIKMRYTKPTLDSHYESEKNEEKIAMNT